MAKKQKEEANKRIINLQNFIKVNLRRGYRQEHIKHVLSRRGFSTDELDRVFRRLNKNSEILEEETVEVEKPGNMFGTTYKFYKKDFLNESQRYILDLNTFNFVENPNVNNRTI